MPLLLQTEELVQQYWSGNALGRRALIRAVDGISLAICPGKTLALVGESGSGKSTLARCIAGLERPSAGRIWFDGIELTALDEKSLRLMRPQMQLIFQHPVSSLNPRFTALEAVSEPLLVQGKLGSREIRERAFSLLERVGLSRDMPVRKSTEFSGGQRQRVAIARALALQPKLLILDEVMSALDCSVQAQIANLLLDLQSSLGLTYLFITHDLSMAAHLADEIAVMDQGRIVGHELPESVVSPTDPEPEAAGDIDGESARGQLGRSFAAPFLLRRLLHALVLLLGVSAITFLFTSFAPGNYFDEMRLNPQIAPETVAALRAQYHLDRPLPVRYLGWANSLVHGRLGFSFSYNSPVGPLLRVRARNSLLLTMTATILAWGLALPLGVWSAAYRGRLPDSVISWLMAALLIVPDLVLGLGLLMLAARTGWFPTSGLLSIGAENLPPLSRMRDLVLHLILPVLVLVLTALPLLVRHVRAAVSDVLEQPFIRAAQANGIPRRRLLSRYALPAAANPLVSLFGFSIGALLSGSLLVEVVMGWPGMGPFLVEAILARDLYVVVGGVLLSTLFLVMGNFIADLLIYWVDPRIRLEPRMP
jgi:peptide/nickel transport system permease protein